MAGFHRSRAPAQRARWTPSRRLALVMVLLADPRLDALVTGDSPFDDLPAVMARLATTAAPETLCHRIHYGTGPTGHGSRSSGRG